MSAILNKGSVFDYFDEVRKVVQTAKMDIFFIDAYLDADFVSRYLPHITQGTTIRLLTKKCLSTLIPAVDLLRVQNGLKIEVRHSADFHDRYLIIDKRDCFQSGASFKDGAKHAPTTFTQVTDAFTAVADIYEKIWSTASPK